MADSRDMAPSEVTTNPTDYDYYTDCVDLNSSSYEIPGFLPMSEVYIPILYCIMFVIGFLGNMFVIVVMGERRKRKPRLVDTFVLNLALADFVFIFTLPLWAASAHNQEWPFGDGMCKVSSFIIAVNRFSNIFFLTCMSVERYLAVVRLMDSRFLRRTHCVHITCALVWIVSFFLGIPSLVYRHLSEETQCSEDKTSPFVQAINLLTIFLTFLLPVVVLGLCYGSILINLRRHCQNAGNARTEARRLNSVKIVFAIITAFLISWLPFNLFKGIQTILHMTYEDLAEDTKVTIYQGLTLSCCLAFLNSCVNPAIYFFLDRHFRLRVYDLCVSCGSRGDTHQGYTSSNSLSNGTETSNYSGNTSTRSRLFSLTQKE